MHLLMLCKTLASGRGNYRGMIYTQIMMTSSNGNIFRVTGHLCREFAGHRWIPHTKASDAKRWCFPWSSPEWTVEETMVRLVIWDAIIPTMTSLYWPGNAFLFITHARYDRKRRNIQFDKNYIYTCKRGSVIPLRFFRVLGVLTYIFTNLSGQTCRQGYTHPDRKIHGANIGPIWGRSGHI